MPQLDGLRAYAAMSVVAFHTEFTGFEGAWHLGPLGVRLFFVLSGFLITGILLRARQRVDEDGQNRGSVLVAFYARRMLRIFPLYYFVLFSCLLIGVPSVRDAIYWHAAYLSNFLVFVNQGGEAGTNHLWSLSVEEQFYLLWPSVVLFPPRRWLAPLFASCVLVAPAFRLGMYEATGNRFVEFLTISCIDTLGIGSLLALIQFRAANAEVTANRFVRSCLGCGIALALAFWLLNEDRFPHSIRFALRDTSAAFIFVWLVAGASRGFRGAGRFLLQNRVAVYLGTISYGIYVYHAVIPCVIIAIERKCDIWLRFPYHGGVVHFMLLAILTVGVSAASWYLLERPINSLKRFFPYYR